MSSSPFAAALISPALIIAENNYFVALIETKPLVLGHVVVVSKRLEDHLFDLNDEELGSLMVFSKPIAKAIQSVIPCKKVGVAVIGLETRHAHLHLVPISSADDLNFTKAKLNIELPEILATVEKIRLAIR